MPTASYGLLLGAYFGAAFNTSGAGTTQLVPGTFQVAINGRPFMLNLVTDPSGTSYFRRESLPLLRTQADQSRSAGESSVSPENLWRRSMDSWHKGCGQRHYDRETSDPYRFWSSTGVDVWTKGQLQLLNSVQAQNSGLLAGESNTKLVVAGDKIFCINDGKIFYTSGGSGTWTWTQITTGVPVGNPVDIATNGYWVWIGYTNAVYHIDSTNVAAGATRIVNTSSGGGTLGTLGFNKGRLFVEHISTGAGEGVHVHEIADNTDKDIHNAANPTVIPNNFRYVGYSWTAFAGLGGYHYFAANAGDKSVIYKATLQPDATALTNPVVAGELPEGEMIYSLGSYLGFLLIGTSLGVRLASTDDNGYLVIGSLIETGQPCYAFEPQGKYVWFGWGNYSATKSGLGRVDLSEFISTLTPAYASDLMANGSGVTKSVVTFGDKRVFSIAGLGVFTETSIPVASGILQSGFITHGIVDRKVPVFLDARLNPLPADTSISLYFSTDEGVFTKIGSEADDGATATAEFFLGTEGRTFEVQTELTATGSTGPVCTGVLLRSYPAPKRLSRFSVPVLLYDTIRAKDQDHGMNVAQEYDALLNLHKSQQVFVYQEGDESYTVVMDDYDWLPEKQSAYSGWQGTFVARLREIL